MTKNFAQAPKPRPSPEAIAAFERGGSGQDRRTHIPSNAGRGEPTEVVVPAPQTHIPSNAGRGEPTEVGEPDAEAGRQERTRRLSVDLPESWHRRFKTACSRTDRKMLAEVTAFIKSRTIELENEEPGRGRP
jgi:hypothetical protein